LSLNQQRGNIRRAASIRIITAPAFILDRIFNLEAGLSPVIDVALPADVIGDHAMPEGGFGRGFGPLDELQHVRVGDSQVY
jgi:hypothetical protein